MNYSIKEIRTTEDSRKVARHAGGKARADICDILSNNGFSEITINVDGDRGQNSALSKLLKHREIYKKWLKACNPIRSGDAVVIQYPIIDHSLFMGKLGKKLKSRNVRIVLLVHDLAMLRTSNDVDPKIKKRQSLEEGELIKYADIVIVHNEHMKELLKQKGISGTKMISLQIFDYYLADWDPDKVAERNIKKDEPVIIAGNLSKDKSGYVYELPDNQHFNLYGINYTDDAKSNIDYKGSFDPEELPMELSGSFGLVWDGPSTSTCSGIYGEYLQFNNPHKTSLYLASEIPVIIWRKAALASFILENRLGIAVDSIDEIPNVVLELSDDEYSDMLSNVRALAPKLRNGEYTISAMEKAFR